MGNTSAVLEGDHVAHLVVQVEDLLGELRFHIDVDIMSDTHLLQLKETGVVSDDFLGKVCSIERVNTVGADHSSLDVY